MKSAVCVLNGDVKGVVQFNQQSPNHPVHITGYINGLTKGLHGFHIHEYGDISNGCTSAGEHFNPFKLSHGAPEDTIRHLGDLGNINATSSFASTNINIMDDRLSLFGNYSVIGRSLVVHADPDDLGKANNLESKKSGNSGARVGCGVIGISK